MNAPTEQPAGGGRAGKLYTRMPRLNVSVVVTTQLVTDTLALPRLPCERTIDMDRVKHHHAELLAGNFRPPTWAVCVLPSGARIAVNSRHTATLFAKMIAAGVDVSGICVHLQEFECQDMEEVRQVWRSFDPPKSSKTRDDILVSVVASDERLAALGRRSITTAAPALAFEVYGPRQKLLTPRQSGQLMLEHADAILWLDCFHGTGKALEHMTRMPVLAAVLKCYRVAPREAEIFWTLVLDGSGPNPLSADRALRDHLKSHSLNNRLQKSSRVNAEEMHFACIAAWNTWCDGKSRPARYSKNKPCPRAAVPTAACAAMAKPPATLLPPGVDPLAAPPATRSAPAASPKKTPKKRLAATPDAGQYRIYPPVS